MGLIHLLWKNEEFHKLYNCSFYSVDDVPLDERQDRLFAIFIAFLGIVFEIAYAPCIYALSCPQVLAASFCYKLMLLMSVYDAVSLAITSLLPAYFSYNGYMFCSKPDLMYASGSVLHGFWLGYSQTSLILAFNRCMSFSRYRWIFKDWRQYVWMSVPIAFTVSITLFGSAGMYNSVYKGWFFDPHLSYYPDLENNYSSRVQFYNNIIFIFMLPLIYIIFVVHHFLLARRRSSGMPKKAMGLFIQTLIINITISLSALGYTLMQHFDLPKQAVAASHISWILVQSAPPFIYLTINQTVRQILFSKHRDITSPSSTNNYKRMSGLVKIASKNSSSTVGTKLNNSVTLPAIEPLPLSFSPDENEIFC